VEGAEPDGEPGSGCLEGRHHGGDGEGIGQIGEGLEEDFLAWVRLGFSFPLFFFKLHIDVRCGMLSGWKVISWLLGLFPK
jgi:hypothetical protein